MIKQTKKLSFIILLNLLLPVIGVAAENLHSQELKYRCENVGGISEWVIEIDLGLRKMASLFDNSTWALGKLDHVQSIETFPPQEIYTFESLDRSEKGKYSLRFNRTKKTALITLMLDKKLRVMGSKCETVDEFYGFDD